MKVLVTGHEGYIGSVLAPYLADAGHDVVGLDTGLYRGCDFGAEPRRLPALAIDVRDVVPGDLAGFDAVVHYAALSNDPLGDLDPGLTEDINRDGTLRLARAARDAGVRRFIFASSCSMYGASGTDDPLDESAPLHPLTAYAESKVRSEEGLFALAEPDFAPVSMRNATVFGASPRLRLDIVLNNLAAYAHTTGRITPAQRRDGVASARPRPRRREDGADAARGAGGRDSRRGVQRRHATSRTTAFASWPRSSRRSPAARSRSPTARPPTTGRIASTSRSSPSRSPDSLSTGTRSEARASSSLPTARSG